MTEGAMVQTLFEVQSRDGTTIGCRTSGTGRPLVLVHGATADHSRWRPVLPLLEPHATVYAIDRRGRGASGDHATYAIEREYEDIAAVVDAAAASFGGPVDLLGHSYGGLVALGAATLTPNLRRLVLYEPADAPDATTYPPGLLERLDALLAAGQRESVLETLFRVVVQMPDEELARFRALPAWQARIAAAHTLPRELRVVFDDAGYDADRVAGITVPTLLVLGGDSPASVREQTELLAETLPDARIDVLEGQQHVAIDMAPEQFTERVLAFLQR